MNKFTLLIIEDESLIALNLKNTLEKNNYCVIGVAKDCTSAISYIENNKVDLILADISIKGHLNGIETVKVIQNSSNIPAIFLTAHQEEKFLREASEVNFMGYIVKPYTEEILLRELKLAYFRLNNNQPEKASIKISDNTYYCIQNQIFKKENNEISLSRNEKKLLHFLIINRNKIVTIEEIDLMLWHDDPVDDTARRQLFFRLRKKIPELNVETMKGVGYKLIV